MSIAPLSLADVQQTFAALADEAPTASGASLAADFAATLAQATTAIALTDEYATIGDNGVMDELPGSASAILGEGSSASTSSIGTTSNDSLLSSLLAGANEDGASSGLSDVDTTPTTTASTDATPVVDDVVSEAAGLEGTPYVWGGTSPSGFDCSGFTQYVFGQLGVELPRTSEEQATVGTAVSSLADAQPGDLVFFAGSDGTASAPGHVGIYVGDGAMIDAPHTGTAVQEQSVASAGTVVAIRRVLSDTGAPTMMGRVSVPAAYAPTVESASAANGIPASLLASLLYHESGFNPHAVSSAGAIGIAQFMPSTAAGMGVDPSDPTQAIEGAAKLLGAYTKRFGSYADALAAYNAGASAVATYGGIPPYPETEAYVPEVLASADLSTSDGVLA